jgi:hypothetical protein
MIGRFNVPVSAYARGRLLTQTREEAREALRGTLVIPNHGQPRSHLSSRNETNEETASGAEVRAEQTTFVDYGVETYPAILSDSVEV